MRVTNAMRKQLGRHHHEDRRDYGHLLLARLELQAAEEPASKLWTISSQHLDQGNTGTCVGHGWRNFLRCAPIQTSAVSPSAFDIYRAAVLLDPWKENDNEAKLKDGDSRMDSGTTVRAGAKALAAMKKLVSYGWAFDFNTAAKWVLTQGPLVLGTNWYSGMFSPDSEGNVTISGTLEGGHCYLWRGRNTKKSKKKPNRCTNSWGNGFGDGGDFYLSDDDMAQLISNQGECCTAIQR